LRGGRIEGRIEEAKQQEDSKGFGGMENVLLFSRKSLAFYLCSELAERGLPGSGILGLGCVTYGHWTMDKGADSRLG
jgi:hypothetical protein